MGLRRLRLAEFATAILNSHAKLLRREGDFVYCIVVVIDKTQFSG